MKSRTGIYGKVTFNPALSMAARKADAAAAGLLPETGAAQSLAGSLGRTASRFSAQPAEKGAPEKAVSFEELKEGDYYVKPDLATLQKLSHEELVSLKGLVVSRKGYGDITFLEPVDLTNVPKLAGLLGDLIRFEDKECTVYPEGDEAEKPPNGEGLNVKARIELLHCWALDKEKREPIKDQNNKIYKKHLERLKKMKDTHFESFETETGKWTFTVDHF